MAFAPPSKKALKNIAGYNPAIKMVEVAFDFDDSSKAAPLARAFAAEGKGRIIPSPRKDAQHRLLVPNPLYGEFTKRLCQLFHPKTAVV